MVNGKEYSNDLLEYSEGRGNPNITLISESGLYRILAKCNLPKCEPWFVAKDVCDCLELGNVLQTCSRLYDDEGGIILNDTPPLASKKCLSYQSPVCTVLSVRLKNKKPKRSNVGSLTKCSRPSAKQVENWSKMPKKTLWRWLGRLEKARRISTFSYLKKWM